VSDKSIHMNIYIHEAQEHKSK